MSDGSRGRDWVAEAEKLLTSLKSVARASITLSDDRRSIAQVDILAEGDRPPKQIVRDVRSALKAEYQVDVDYRKVSVALIGDSGPDDPVAVDLGPTVLTLPSAQVYEEPAVLRMRYGRVSAVYEQNTCEIQVELGLDGRETLGEAQGSNSRRVVPRLVGEATLGAVTKFLDPSYAFALSDVEVVRVGDQEVVLAVVKFYKERSEKVLTGSCPVTHDLHQAIVYATLNALNRFLGRLRYREPVEYEIRPTSLP